MNTPIVRSIVLATSLLLLSGVATTVSGQSRSHHPPPKSDTHVLQHPVGDDRDGGEYYYDAVPIPSLPYTDTGATCDNINDHDESCPYTGSTSPDVFYSLFVAEDVELTVDMCGSLYDTKIYVLDLDLQELACNDDFYFDDECGVYVSKIEELYLDAGQTVYIGVDGYGGDCGEYIMVVSGNPYPPCVLECPPGGMFEGEPPLEDGYEDAYNGGCNSPQFGNPFQELWGTGDHTLVFCGKSGWYDYGGYDYRDTDWFFVWTAPDGDGVINVEIDAEEGIYLFDLWPQDCESGFHSLVEAGPCSPNALSRHYNPGDLVWICVGPTQFVPPYGFVGHEFDYVMTLSGIMDGVVSGEEATWSDVKGLYR